VKVYRSAFSLYIWRVYHPTPIGFPPLDADLRDWLVSDSDDDRGTVQKKLHGFIYSLLMVTREKLETIAKKQGDYFPTARQITCQWHRRYIRVTSSQ
jgi:hypothetical protein